MLRKAIVANQNKTLYNNEASGVIELVYRQIVKSAAVWENKTINFFKSSYFHTENASKILNQRLFISNLKISCVILGTRWNKQLSRVFEIVFVVLSYRNAKK